MKKIVMMVLCLVVLAGCSTGKPKESDSNTTSDQAKINVYTRDASSGTREAFEKAIGLDEVTIQAIEVSSNGDMANKVGVDNLGIGYVSLSTDFEAYSLVPLAFEGVSPSVDTVLDGSYGMQRPFSYVTRASNDFDTDEKEELVAAFLDFLNNSTEGKLAIQSAGGIVNVNEGKPWASLAENHPIVNQDNSSITLVTAGSTSVSKTLQAALEMFQPLAGNVQFTMNQTGSSDGYKRVLGDEKDGSNAADIGFASRGFKTEEDVSGALETGVYCIDAVVVVVNNSNDLNSITQQQLVDIFSGAIESFDEVQ